MTGEVEIVTFRDIFQYEALKKGRYSEEFQKASALVFLDKGDMEALGINDGERVKLENDVGSVVVSARASVEEVHPGVAFMTNSPWANQLVPDQVCQTSIPDFKKIKAKVSPSGEELTKIEDLLQRMRA